MFAVRTADILPTVSYVSSRHFDSANSSQCARRGLDGSAESTAVYLPELAKSFVIIALSTRIESYATALGLAVTTGCNETSAY